MNLGKASLHILPATNTLPPNSELAAQILYICGFLTALTLWGFGLIWLMFAIFPGESSVVSVTIVFNS